jgi:hypothetical protein
MNGGVVNAVDYRAVFAGGTLIEVEMANQRDWCNLLGFASMAKAAETA